MICFTFESFAVPRTRTVENLTAATHRPSPRGGDFFPRSADVGADPTGPLVRLCFVSDARRAQSSSENVSKFIYRSLINVDYAVAFVRTLTIHAFERDSAHTSRVHSDNV